MLVDETNERGSPRERKVFAKEKETRALLSRVKPIGVNCNRLGWVWISPQAGRRYTLQRSPRRGSSEARHMAR